MLVSQGAGIGILTVGQKKLPVNSHTEGRVVSVNMGQPFDVVCQLGVEFFKLIRRDGRTQHIVTGGSPGALDSPLGTVIDRRNSR